MKAIYCMSCSDMFCVLNSDEGDPILRSCLCGQSKARFLRPSEDPEERHYVAVYEGTYAIPLGINTQDFIKSVDRQRAYKRNHFEGLILPYKDLIFRRVENLTETSFSEHYENEQKSKVA